jgi:primosomal protein N' (replication factor Y)
LFVEVALDLPLEKTFVYKVGDYVSHEPEVGKRVIVPFGSNDFLRTGIIVDLKEKVEFPEEKVKEVFDIPDDFAVFTESTITLAKWIADYYCASLGEVLFFFLPSGFEITESFRVSLIEESVSKIKLSPSERKIIEALQGRGACKVSVLKRRLKISNFYQSLKNLINKGVVVREEFIEKDSIPKKRFLILKESKALRGAKSKELVEFLERRGKVSVDELKERGFSLAVINRVVKEGVADVVEEKVTVGNRPQELKDLREIELTPSQKKAFEAVTSAESGTFLLYGVTGSGKMEVYLKIAKEFVDRGKSVLILVPELLLTPELRARVESYFGNRIGIFHGKLTQREKVSAWLKAVRGEVKIFIGTRAAVMLPLKDLGLIVVDEEQDDSYKEQQKPYFHAREVAIKRGKREKFPVLLVSATPSVDTYYRVQKGEIEKLELKERVSTVPLPFIKVVNLQDSKRTNIFSKELLTALENTVKKGEQALLFINRRGFFAQSFCPSCGFIAECEDCAVPLVYHRSEKKLICHICGKRYKPVYRCPKCSTRLEFKGYGTERVEEEIKILFPEFKVVRLDQDTVKNPSVGARLIKEIKEGKYDVIVGTQIATKGHNFPKLTLVGILIADLLGGAPDYRGAERIFQSIVHTTGRAGRFKPGAAIVQCFNPDLPAIKFAVEYRFEDFYREELETRSILNYPPFNKGVLVEFQLDKLSGFKKLEEKFRLLKGELSKYFSVGELIPAPIPKVSGRYRFTSFMRALNEEVLLSGIMWIKKTFPDTFRSFRYKIDVEPVRII